MLLSEILEKPSPKIRTSTKAISNVLYSTDEHASVLGTGAQAIAYLHKKYPEKVIKSATISGISDPTYQFVRLCLNQQRNPFFPKFFFAKMYDHKEDIKKEIEFDDNFNDTGDNLVPPKKGKVLVVGLERLERIDKESLFNICNSLDIYNVIKDTRLNPRIERHATSNFDKFRMKFDEVFRQPMNRRLLMKNANNPDFIKALRLMEPLFRHYESDLNLGNIMVRNNAQLVFIDPICDPEAVY